MPRVPHNINKDTLSIYRRPPYLPSSDSSSLSDDGDDEEDKPVVLEGEEGEDEEVEEEESSEEESWPELEDETSSEEDYSEVLQQKLQDTAPPKWTWKVKKDDDTPQTLKDKSLSKSMRTFDKEENEITKAESGLREKSKALFDEESEDLEEQGISDLLKSKDRFDEDSEDADLSDEEEESSDDMYELANSRDRKDGVIIMKPREFDPYYMDSDEMIDAGDEKWNDGWVPSLAEQSIRNIGRHLDIYTGK